MFQWECGRFSDFYLIYFKCQVPSQSTMGINPLYMKMIPENHSFTQFSSVAQSCATLWDPMNCNMSGFSVHHQLPDLLKLMSIELVWCHPTISSSVVPFSRLQSFPASGSFQRSQFFASGSQRMNSTMTLDKVVITLSLPQFLIYKISKWGDWSMKLLNFNY